VPLWVGVWVPFLGDGDLSRLSLISVLPGAILEIGGGMAKTGFIVMADITGYTVYLNESELDHAQTRRRWSRNWRVFTSCFGGPLSRWSSTRRARAMPAPT